MLVEDVLKHLRFCDEFSHVMERSFHASLSLCSLAISIEMMFLTFSAAVELPHPLNRYKEGFSSVYYVLVEDVLKHHRFCDEFSHLMERSFHASLSLCLLPISIEMMF